MNLKRLKSVFQKIRFVSIIDGCKRAEYLRKNNILAEMGENCLFQSRNFPMDPKLVKIHDNVTIAANVTLCTQDAIRHMLYFYDKKEYMPHLGPIEIEENVFVGIGSIIMPDVRIGHNSIVAAGSLVLKDVPSGSIVGGVPAKKIVTFEELHEKRINEGKIYKGMGEDRMLSHSWEEFYSKRGYK